MERFYQNYPHRLTQEISVVNVAKPATEITEFIEKKLEDLCGNSCYILLAHLENKNPPLWED